MSGSRINISALVSDTKPTLANERSWEGYIIGTRYVRSTFIANRTMLIVNVVQLHSLEEGSGAPESKVMIVAFFFL